MTTVLFLVFFFSGCLLSLFKHPIYGILTYELILFLDPVSRWWGYALPNLRWSLTISIVSLIGFIIHKNKIKPKKSAFSYKIYLFYIFFLVWMIIQIPWALSFDIHYDFIILYLKYIIIVWLFYNTIDSEDKLQLFVLFYILGCAYLGWVAYSDYRGGRFEGFGGAGVGDANTSGVVLAISVFFASSLLIRGNIWVRRIVFICIPFILNGIIVSISRGAFIALVSGGIVFLLIAPANNRRQIWLLLIPAIILFSMLSPPNYWDRIFSITSVASEEKSERYTDGSDRIRIIRSQYKMFKDHLFGTGHKGTQILSPVYMGREDLTAVAGKLARASHNTYMSVIVDHGIIGGVLYLLLMFQAFRKVIELRTYGNEDQVGIIPIIVTSIGASFVSIGVGGLSGNFFRLEIVFWIICILMVALNLSREKYN
jgi:O-antigen ligase